MGISIGLPARLERLVSRAAKNRGTTKSEIIRNVLAIFEKEGQKAHGGTTPYQAMKHLIGCASGGPLISQQKPAQSFAGCSCGGGLADERRQSRSIESGVCRPAEEIAGAIYV